MQFETFRGRSVEEALASIKAAFGGDALIGTTRQVTNGRSGELASSIVEVQAAPSASEQPQSQRPQPFSRDVARSVAPPAPAARGPSLRPSAAAPSPRLTELGAQALQALSMRPASSLDEARLKGELTAIRALLEQMTSSMKPKDKAMALLAAARIEPPLATRLVTGAPRAGTDGLQAVRAWLRARVAQQLRVLSSPIGQPGPRLVVAVGPTGVGKTTTLAKLAAVSHLDLGRSTAVVTLDTFRVGSIPQMSRFCELIGTPFDVASDALSFRAALERRGAEVVLVDTASLPATDSGAMRRLAECLDSAGERAVDVLLVLPAAIHARDAARLTAAYRRAAVTGLVITKLDETDQLGGAMHAALPGPIPVAYVCDGPRVPEDIRCASVEQIVDALLPLES
jgi:flagellar biosynthesis protein FlhF